MDWVTAAHEAARRDDKYHGNNTKYVRGWIRHDDVADDENAVWEGTEAGGYVRKCVARCTAFPANPEMEYMRKFVVCGYVPIVGCKGSVSAKCNWRLFEPADDSYPVDNDYDVGFIDE